MKRKNYLRCKYYNCLECLNTTDNSVTWHHLLNNSAAVFCVMCIHFQALLIV